MHSTATLPTSVSSFAAHGELAPTAPSYDVSSGCAAWVRRPHVRQIGGGILRTAVAATFTVGIAGEPVETRAWSPDDFSAEQNVGPLRQSDQRSVLSSAIMAYRHLPQDWDGEGGVAPLKGAIDDALAFIDLLPLTAKLPKPMVSGDGEVGFYWKTGDGYIDVGFFGDGKITYYGRAVREGLEAEGANPFSRTNLPKDLLEVISRV
jgi:hypothetical protein